MLQMRGAAQAQVKVISSQLDVLQELKLQLECLLPHIITAIQKGTAWIEVKENESFMEITQFLNIEISECVRKCYNIANGGETVCQNATEQSKMEETSSSTLNLPYSVKNTFCVERLVQQMEELSTNVSLHSKKIKTMERKFKKQKKLNENMKIKKEEFEKKTNLRFEEIVQELLEASDFMSNLPSEHEIMSKQVEESEEEIMRFINTVKHEQNERIDRIDKEQEEISRELLNTKGRIDEIDSLLERLSDEVSENDQLCKDLQSTKVEISSQKETILKEVHELKILMEEKDQEQKQMSEQIDKKFEQQENNVNLKLDQVPREIADITGSLNKMRFLIEALTHKVDGNEKDNKDMELKVNDIQTKQLHVMDQRIIDVVQKTFTITNEVDTLYKILVDLNTTIACRVQVNPSVEWKIKKDKAITCFNKELLNIGKHYNINTGIFTAPCEGLYLCSLMIECENDADALFSIMLRKNTFVEKSRGRTHTNENNCVSCVVSLLELNKNDEIYIASSKNYSHIRLSNFSYFLCVLLNKYN